MEHKKILHLTLTKQWFDLIFSGVKKEEYRERKKYWKKRIFDKNGYVIPYDIIRFRNGYSKTAPQMDVEYRGVILGTGNVAWGARPNRFYYCIQLGSILDYENVKQDTKPATRSELYTDDRDSMQAEQAVNTDTKGFGGEPIEDNIDSENDFYCYYDHPSYTKCESQCKLCKEGKGRP